MLAVSLAARGSSDTRANYAAACPARVDDRVSVRLAEAVPRPGLEALCLKNLDGICVAT